MPEHLCPIWLNAVAARGYLPLPSCPFPLPVGLQGLPESSPLVHAQWCELSVPHALASPSERLRRTAVTLVNAPLLGFVRWCAPLPSRPFLSTPRSQGFDRRWDTTPIVSFRPRGFAPPRRFSPGRAPELVASRYRTGFAPFPRWPTRFPGPSSTFPMRTHPSKNSPRQQPFRITAACCLLAVHARLPRFATAQPVGHTLARAPCSTPVTNTVHVFARHRLLFLAKEPTHRPSRDVWRSPRLSLHAHRTFRGANLVSQPKRAYPPRVTRGRLPPRQASRAHRCGRCSFGLHHRWSTSALALAPQWPPVASLASEDTWGSTCTALFPRGSSVMHARAPFALNGHHSGLHPVVGHRRPLLHRVCRVSASPTYSSYHRYLRSARLNALSRSPCSASALPTPAPCFHTSPGARLQGFSPPTSP